jgi:hypothetical protein
MIRANLETYFDGLAPANSGERGTEVKRCENLAFAVGPHDDVVVQGVASTVARRV